MCANPIPAQTGRGSRIPDSRLPLTWVLRQINRGCKNNTTVLSFLLLTNKSLWSHGPYPRLREPFFKFPKIASPVLSLHLLPGKFSPFLPRSSSAIRCYLGMAATSSSTATDAETLRRDRILSSKLYLDVPPSKVFPHLSNKQTNKPSRSSHLNPFRVVLFPRFP